MTVNPLAALIAEGYVCPECGRRAGTVHHAECSGYAKTVTREFAYLSSVTMPRHWPAMAAAGIGIMLTPASGVREGVIRALPYWAADNGCYSQGGAFDLDRFMGWLQSLKGFASRCLFAVAPDVVADAAATLDRSLPVLPRLRRLGFRAAFVAQDGLESMEVPWGEFDVLFIGGSTEWKLGEHAYRLAAEAARRGKNPHMGRVNSLQRLRAANAAGYASADGTHSSFGPDKRIPQLCRWMAEVRRQPGLLR